MANTLDLTARPLEVRRVRVAKVNPAPYNPRKDLQPGDAEYEALRRSLEEFGFVEPLVWNKRTGNLVGGHQRFKILIAGGAKQVDVSVVDLPLPREKALNIALNKTGGDWDEVKLGALLKELQAMPELDATVTGFSAREIDRLLRELEPPRKESPDSVERATTAAQTLHVTRGQVWRLGRHRLMCGDARNGEDFGRLMAGQKAALVATDPPYLIDYTGADRPKHSGKDWTHVYQEVPVQEAESFFLEAFQNALAHAEDDAAWYVWHAHKRAAIIEQVWEHLGILNHQQIVWVKPSAVHTYSYWPWRHEPCLMGWRRGFKPKHDGDNSHALTTVWEFGWDGAAKVTGNEHPTQKPVELWELPIQKHTAPGEIVLDLFLGSGTAVIAAERLNRCCYAMEISPAFCAVAIARWQLYTGAKATLEDTTTPAGRRRQRVRS